MSSDAGNRVVVLGGTGFVGRHVCGAFAATGHDVLAMARQPPRRLPHRFVALDLLETSSEALAETLESVRPDVIVNATGSSWGLTEEDMAIHCVLPTRRLLEAVALVSFRPRLVQLGSVLEYGPVPKGEPVRTTSAGQPRTAYGRAKLVASRAVVDAAAAGRIDGLVLRLANVVGPGVPDTSLLGKVGRLLLRSVERDTPATVELSPLRAFRDYVDARDVADAVVAAAAVKTSGCVIDIGRGEAVSVRALVDLMIAASGVPARVVEREAGAENWRNEVDWLVVDPRPAREELGWRPRRSLREAVRAVWEDIAGQQLTFL